VLAGFDLALRTWGTMPWPALLKHAIHVAESGFVVDTATAGFLERWNPRTDDISRRAFFPDGHIPKSGDTWIQKDLAGLLRRISDEGPQDFYTGEIAAQIASHIQSHGGILSQRDFADYRPHLVAPLSVSYRGHDIFVPPPPAGGLTTLQILKTLENFDLHHLEPWSAQYFHLFTQAARLCWQDRLSSLGDPDFVKISIEQLLSEQSARAKSARIQTGKLGPMRPVPATGPHTANVTIVDQFGNVVSLTATLGFVFGSHVVIPGLGLIMGHGISRFDFEPGHPNSPAPGKRMHHNMAPTVILADGRPRYALGLPGGTKIITVTAQMIINFIDFQTTPQENVVAPRIHAEGDEPLAVSSKVSDQTIAQLKAMGHLVVRGQKVGGQPNEIAGSSAHAVSIDPGTGVPSAAGQAEADVAMVISG
jgi:gamma-glutamyltranspeptidase / glutathione hydrolase